MTPTSTTSSARRSWRRTPARTRSTRWLDSRRVDDQLPASTEIAEIVDADRPEPEDQGLVLFFTGLSGSGKSTLARALMDLLLEQGGRSVTSLDGDVVRRHLSAGLTFSKADRETNIRRIGWVAAEIARHGGVAVCSPIAPFAETREQVREMVEDAGGAFFLVHVATPLEECERRDRKGLYAKARAGEIPEFTGISSPYEEPDDPAVRVDTTGRTIEDALDDVLVALDEAGYLHLAGREARRMSEPLRCSSSAPPTSAARPPWSSSPGTSPATDPTVVFSSAGTHGSTRHRMNPDMVATLPDARRRRLPQPPADAGDPAGGRPGADRRVDPPPAHPRRLPPAAPQGLHRWASSPRPWPSIPDLAGRELVAAAARRRTAGAPRARRRRPLPARGGGGRRRTGTITAMLSVDRPRLAGDR